MINSLALAPALVLLLGALALLPAKAYGRVRPFIPLAAILLTLLFLFLNPRQPNPVQLAFPGASTGTDLDLAVNYDTVSLFMAGLVLLAFAAQLLVENLRPDTLLSPGALVMLAGAVVFFGANNWVTLAAGWVLADLGLLATRLEAAHDSAARASVWRALGVSQFGLLLFLAAGVSLLNDVLPLRLAETQIGAGAATLVILAAWIRSGLYPFHYIQSGDADSSRNDHLRDLGITALLGLYLLIRAVLQLQEDPLYSDLLQLVALLGLGVTTLLALLEHREPQRVGWIVCAIGAPLFLLPIAAVVVHASFILWLLLGLFNFISLAWAAAAFGPQTLRQPWRQVLWGAAMLCAAGFPLTPGFLGHIGYYTAAIQAGNDWLLIVLFSVTTLLLIPLWRIFFAATTGEARKPTPVEYVSIALLLLPVLIEGIAPFRVTALFGKEVEDASAFAYDALFHAPSLGQPIILIVATILPLPLAFFLARAVDPLRGRLGNAPNTLVSWLDLSAPTDAIVAIADTLGGALHQLSALIELHPMGWVLFAAIWVALWLLNIR